jgi:hypothetical protein
VEIYIQQRAFVKTVSLPNNKIKHTRTHAFAQGKKHTKDVWGRENFLPLYRLEPRSIREILKHFKLVHEYAIVNFSCVLCAKNRQALAQSALGI